MKTKITEVNSMNFKVVSYLNIYRSSLLNLMQQMWEGMNFDQVEELFKWRYELNPFQKDDYMYLAVDDHGRVVGFRAFVAQEFCINDDKILVFCPADAFVHPDYRRRKIYSKLTDNLLDNLNNKKQKSTIISLSSNKKSTAANLMLGWVKANNVINYGYRFNFFGTYFGNRSITYSQKELDVNEYSLFFSKIIEENELATFNQLHPARPVITNCRSRDYYKWRYRQHPQKENYIFVYLRKKGELCAYLICRKVSPKQIILEEYNFEKIKDFKLLMSRAVKNLKPFVVRTWILNKYEEHIFYQCGFLKENPIITNVLNMDRFPVTVRPLTIEPEEDDFFVSGFDIRDLNNWKLFIADKH